MHRKRNDHAKWIKLKEYSKLRHYPVGVRSGGGGGEGEEDICLTTLA